MFMIYDMVYYIIWYCIILYGIILYYIILYYIILYYIILWYRYLRKNVMDFLVECFEVSFFTFVFPESIEGKFFFW